jgi:hypothetical protein
MRRIGRAQRLEELIPAWSLPPGYSFVEKTGCSSGSPYTYWAPEWASDPV